MWNRAQDVDLPVTVVNGLEPEVQKTSLVDHDDHAELIAWCRHSDSPCGRRNLTGLRPSSRRLGSTKSLGLPGRMLVVPFGSSVAGGPR